jgi:biotin synthase
MDAICAMVEGVNALGLQSCMTLGMLTEVQAQRLSDAGLDYYNHNLDTSPEHYGSVITTRSWQDRLDTLEAVRDAGINVCCGGIVGMGETREDRVDFGRAPLGGPRKHVGCHTGALLPGGGRLNLHRRQIADHRQCRRRRGRCFVCQAGAGADG